MHRPQRLCLALLAVLCGCATALPAAAGAADRIYWGNNNGTSISFANLDGGGAGDLGGPAATPAGLAIDSATGRIFYTNEGENKISFLNPDGSAGGSLNTGTATVEVPDGLAIDPATRRIYWANDVNPGSIAFAGLDGGGGGNLNTTGAPVQGPSGVAVDPSSGRLYWSNYNGVSIGFAKLDNSGGGGELDTTGASMDGPAGVAIDPVSRRIFWSDYGNGVEISFARLDGSGGGDLPTPGATVQGPWGVAIDPDAGRVYWANNSGGSLAFARLDGSGGGPVSTPGATVDQPAFPIVQKAPSGTGAPTISGGSKVGSTLSCSQGSWAADIFEALLYRAPSAFAYSWSRDGKQLAGAVSESLSASKAGLYRCSVSGSNQAGSSTQTSEPHRVGPPVPPDFSTAIFDGSFLYLRLKCPARFKPQCLGSAAAITTKDRCVFRQGRRQCKRGTPITATVSAKQKPTRWHVAKLRVKPKYRARVRKMARKPKEKLLLVRQSLRAKGFKNGLGQSVYHIYRVLTEKAG